MDTIITDNSDVEHHISSIIDMFFTDISLKASSRNNFYIIIKPSIES